MVKAAWVLRSSDLGGFQRGGGLAASRALKFTLLECIFPLYEFNRS